MKFNNLSAKQKTGTIEMMPVFPELYESLSYQA